MNEPHLNDDILLHVTSVADTKTQRALLHTNWALQHHGAKYLLKGRGRVTLATDAEIHSFFSFILRDITARSRYLHHLALSGFRGSRNASEASPPEWAMLLGELFLILADRGNLRSLTIENAEEVLSWNPRILMFVARLRTLKELHVSPAGLLCLQMVQSLQLSLVAACIEWNGRRQPRISGLVFLITDEDRNPIPLLANSSQSLNRLISTMSNSSPEGPVCHNLVTLELSYTEVTHTWHFIRASLNLQVFDVVKCDAPCLLEHTRAANVLDQMSLGSWPSLRLCENSSVAALYALAIQCHICSLKIQHFDECLETYMIRAVQEDSRPLHLSLHVPDADMLSEADFPALLSQPCVRELRFFRSRRRHQTHR